MKRNKARKGIILIVITVCITFLILMTYQMIEDYGKVKKEKEEYDSWNEKMEYDDKIPSAQPISSGATSLTIAELLFRDGIKFLLKSIQICLFIALILFIIWLTICSIRKEIKFVDEINVIVITLALFIAVSFILFIANFGVEG
mgnify:CR=1 FL=1